MTFTSLISIDDLAPHLNDPDWVIVDCRASLADPGSAESAYLQGHIPGAGYANLERDLSGPVIPGATGRHPLPLPELAGLTFSRLGIGTHRQVVAYDDAGGAMAAGRMWWMLHWLGLTAAAVLDGGWQAWKRRELPARQGAETRAPQPFHVRTRPELVFSTEQVERVRRDPAFRLIDARSADRFHGKNEKIDPVAGRIPGALNAPYLENLTPEGTFRSRAELRQKYQALLGAAPLENVVFYCGSGVSAVHDILAVSAAGLGEARLYPGSWSEWITDPNRPVARD
jgi:thiosulfate/3-mercaptopyruvate sulfurtransferase